MNCDFFCFCRWIGDTKNITSRCKQWYLHLRWLLDLVQLNHTHHLPLKPYPASSAAWGTQSRSRFKLLVEAWESKVIVKGKDYIVSVTWTSSWGSKGPFSNLVWCASLGGHRGACQRLLFQSFVLGFSNISSIRMFLSLFSFSCDLCAMHHLGPVNMHSDSFWSSCFFSYPKDSEKIMLARQTGLTRSQVC